jgi:hypothetical protein
MRKRIVLPEVNGFRLLGFQPIFNRDITMRLRRGVNVILGGNGLGKTTLVQAIIYGLTGGSPSDEQDKTQRWDHGYFRGRLSTSLVRRASVEVEFTLGTARLTVRRAFTGSTVTAFRTDDSTTDKGFPKEPDQAYARALTVFGGYESEEDFAFIVHRMLYLPESRRLLAWDTDAQLRLLMLLNQDVVPDGSFDARRRYLKELDSKKRHVHVALGHAQRQLSELMEYEEESKELLEEGLDEQHIPDAESSEPNGVELWRHKQNELNVAARSRSTLERDVQEVSKLLSEISDEVERLQSSVDSEEANLVLNFLSKQERENQLAMEKLVQLGLCPVCGTHQAELQATASRHSREHLCVLCGSDVYQNESTELATLRSRLSEKLVAQKQLEASYQIAEGRLQLIASKETALQHQVNEVRFSDPVVALSERQLPAESEIDLEALKKKLEVSELEYEAQIRELTNTLEAEYTVFREAVSARVERLRASYTRYATKFLGLDCSLAEATGSDRFLNLMRFIPFFGGSKRETPESCSEAQRFFLDIAFRLALIDLETELSGHVGAFICETPENALDLSYVANVVEMFESFAKKRHVLLLTANVQVGGIAEQLLHRSPKTQRAGRILNLLQVGQLSEVHKHNQRKLESAVRRIMG